MVLRVEDLTHQEDLEVLVSAVAHLGKPFIDAPVESCVCPSVCPYIHAFMSVRMTSTSCTAVF